MLSFDALNELFRGLILRVRRCEVQEIQNSATDDVAFGEDWLICWSMLLVTLRSRILHLARERHDGCILRELSSYTADHDVRSLAAETST